MRTASRVENSLLNVITGVFGQAFSFFLSFISRTVFIMTLGELYLGLNGLYSNILSVLNLTELGLGTAIVIELYRTVEKNDIEKTLQYIQLYKKAYRIIGLIILILGLMLTPFLSYLIKDQETLGIINYKLIFIFYLINTTFSYFSFEYRQSILQANQAEYKSRIVTYIFKFLEMIMQIVCLWLFKSIYLYLIIPILLHCISTVVKGMLVAKWYPYITEKPNGKLTKDELNVTMRNIGSVAVYKISGCVINSTDNIILSSFISILITGIYSNYLIIVSAIKTILEKVFSAFTASIGNLNVSVGENYEKKCQIFKTISFLNFWFYGMCSICMFVLFEPFVTIWLGEKFVLDSLSEFFIMLNFLVFGLQETVGTHRAAYGLFYKGRFRPIFTIFANIILSVGFVAIVDEKYGIVAVLLGTIVSNLCVSWWYDAYIVHKYALNASPKQYYFIFWLRVIYVVALSVILKGVCSFIAIMPIVDVIVYALICVAVYNGLFFVLFKRRSEFIYLQDCITHIWKKTISRKVKR